MEWKTCQVLCRLRNKPDGEKEVSFGCGMRLLMLTFFAICYLRFYSLDLLLISMYICFWGKLNQMKTWNCLPDPS